MSTRKVYGGAEEEASKLYGYHYENTESARPTTFTEFTDERINQQLGLLAASYKTTRDKIRYRFQPIEDDFGIIDMDRLRIEFQKESETIIDPDTGHLMWRTISSANFPLGEKHKKLWERQVAEIIAKRTLQNKSTDSSANPDVEANDKQPDTETNPQQPAIPGGLRAPPKTNRGRGRINKI